MNYVIDKYKTMTQKMDNFEGNSVEVTKEVLNNAVDDGIFADYETVRDRRLAMAEYLNKTLVCYRNTEEELAEKPAEEGDSWPNVTWREDVLHSVMVAAGIEISQRDEFVNYAINFDSGNKRALKKADLQIAANSWKAMKEADELDVKWAKAVADAEVLEKKLAELKTAELEIRKSEFDGMVKAGIPYEIVNLWCNGDLAKGDMFFMLKTLGSAVLHTWEEEVCIIADGRIPEQVPKYFEGDIREKISMLDSLIQEYNDELIDYTFRHPSLVDKKFLQFLIKCYVDDNLQLLFLRIINDDFELKYAYNLVNDLGFDEHPEALKEVIEGANWEAVAVKHGFLQFD